MKPQAEAVSLIKKTERESQENKSLHSNSKRLKPIDNDRLSSRAQQQRSLPQTLPEELQRLVDAQDDSQKETYTLCAKILNKLINRAVTGNDDIDLLSNFNTKS